MTQIEILATMSINLWTPIEKIDLDADWWFWFDKWFYFIDSFFLFIKSHDGTDNNINVDAQTLRKELDNLQTQMNDHHERVKTLIAMDEKDGEAVDILSRKLDTLENGIDASPQGYFQFKTLTFSASTSFAKRKKYH